MAEEITGVAVAKRLASCNKATRDRALRLFIRWLPSSPSVSDEDLLKIWKGLFFCVWHADKAPDQADLARRISSLLLSLPLPLASRYLSSFLRTLRREWTGIDHHRLDKYYALIRSFVSHILAFLAAHHWDASAVSSLIAVLSEGGLLAADRYPAQGVAYHVSQVFLDELHGFLPLPVATIEALLAPFFVVMGTSRDRTLTSKIKTNVFQRLLDNGCRYLKSSADVLGDEAEKLGRIALGFGFSRRFLDLASAEGTVQCNRKVLFDLHASFSKLERDLEKSGLQVSLEVPESDRSLQGSVSDTFVTKSMEDDGSHDSEERPSKKRKKKGKKGSSASQDHIDSKSESVADAAGDNDNPITFSEILMSNLQKQFEKVASEEGMVTPVASIHIKKRKRPKSADGKVSGDSKYAGDADSKTPVGEYAVVSNGKSAGKSTKRVRFSMKSNLIWKPHSPLPPHSLRLPPSATPRGSALKKGVLPGPVKEATPPSSRKKVKAKSSTLKKVRRSTKSISPGAKRLRKFQNSI